MSNDDSIPVETKNLSICKVKINIYQLVFHVGFRCEVHQYDENDTLLKSTDLSIRGNEYDQWASDNEMINLILSKCGLVPKTIPSENVEINYNPVPSLINPENSI